MKTQSIISASLLALGLAMAQPALAQHIQVPDGNGGWQQYKPQPKSDVIGSSTYGGKTIVVRKKDNGHSVTTTDATGSKTEFHGPEPKGISVDDGKGGWKPYVPQPKSDVIGSSTYGGKAIVVRKADGGHTVSTTDAGGTKTEFHGPMPKGISVGDGKGGWMKYVPLPKSKVIASTTFDGETREVNRKHEITITGGDGGRRIELGGRFPVGISVPDGLGGWMKFKPKPKSKVVASSTFEGKTTVVTLNPDGTHTVTVTENGVTTSTVH